jgi:hypothetical protein
MSALVAGEVNQLGGLAHGAQGRFGHDFSGRDKGDDTSIVIGIHFSVEDDRTGYALNDLDQGFDHFAPAPFTEIGNAFNQGIHEYLIIRNCELHMIGWIAGYFLKSTARPFDGGYITL